MASRSRWAEHGGSGNPRMDQSWRQDWPNKPTSYELIIFNLKIPTVYKANLYSLECKDAEGGAWVGTARLVDTGYVARVLLSARASDNAYPEDCRISADTGPLWWSWKPLNPPECDRETAGECNPHRWTGADTQSVDFSRSHDDVDLKFEVFFRESKRPIEFELVCEKPIKKNSYRTKIDVDASNAPPGKLVSRVRSFECASHDWDIFYTQSWR
jgi:hypothetical protein